MFENICQKPQHWSALGQAAQAEQARITNLRDTETSQARRGMRYGMQQGMLAGASFAHALMLPYDHFVGTGPALLPATWTHHKETWRRGAAAPADADPCARFGAPRGLLGPLLAAAVGFVAGSARLVAMLLGTAAALVTSPQLLGRGAHSAQFKAHLKHHGKLWGEHGLALGGAAAALVTASLSDVTRLPSLTLKTVLPLGGLMMGACIGSIRGLRESYPGDVTAWVARCGQFASTTSPQSVAMVLGAAYLWYWTQRRVTS